MPYLLEFETFLPYDQGLDGITVQTTIGFSDSAVTFPAKIDTGSSVCIFERSHGESLGLEIESGVFQRIGTATGTFNSYGFHVALKVAGLIFDSLVFFPENEHIKKKYSRTARLARTCETWFGRLRRQTLFKQARIIDPTNSSLDAVDEFLAAGEKIFQVIVESAAVCRRHQRSDDPFKFGSDLRERTRVCVGRKRQLAHDRSERLE